MDQETRQAFDQILKSLNSLETKVDSLEAKVDSMESRMASLETKVDSVESRMDSLEFKMDALQERQAQTNKAVRSLETFTRQGFDTLIGMIESLDIRKADKLASS